MSIVPSRNLAQAPSSSPQSRFRDPNFNHGSDLPQPQQLSSSPGSPPDEVGALRSLQISDSRSFGNTCDDLSGPLATASEDHGESAKKVNEDVEPNGKDILPHQKAGANIQHDVAGHGGVGSAQHKGPRIQQSAGSAHRQGSSMQSVGKKGQTVNGNHLLNFHYSPISRPQPRAAPPRRLQKRKPYNKDLFLQANYKFVLLDSGNHGPDSMDPDKALQWEDIVCVKYFTPHSVRCPICLEDLLCPQMTSCGHIFCFPCILRYFLMDRDDHRGDGWKKCPLCFMMLSSKDLYTIYIENVKQHFVDDNVVFMLLTRRKDSLTLSVKSNQMIDADQEVDDSFSKCTFTSDVDLSVRKAISELDSWLARAQSGLVDDLEKLPYVCAAMEHLQERKKFWNEHLVSNGDNSSKNNISHSSSPPNGSMRKHDSAAAVTGTISAGTNDKSILSGMSKLESKDEEPCLLKTGDMESWDDSDTMLSSSNDDGRSSQMYSSDKKNKDTYIFYQAVDGQHLILHQLNMKCLLHHYGSYDKLPTRISGKILQLETVTHFSLTTTFQLCEIDLSGELPPDALSPFMAEIKSREKQRKRIAKKEQEDNAKAEAAAAAASVAFSVPTPSARSRFDDYSPVFSMDDFEVLGSSSPAPTSYSPPTIGERPLFSNVTRLGFASGHDSPALRNEESQFPPKNEVSGSDGGSRNGGATSFASVITRAKTVEPKIVGASGKKGKKPSRVLLSTAGGRRY